MNLKENISDVKLNFDESLKKLFPWVCVHDLIQTLTYQHYCSKNIVEKYCNKCFCKSSLDLNISARALEPTHFVLSY